MMRGVTYAAIEIIFFMVGATAIGYYLGRIHLRVRGSGWKRQTESETQRRVEAGQKAEAAQERVRDLELRLTVATQAIRELEDTNAALRKAVSTREARLAQLEEKRRRRRVHERARGTGPEITLRTGVANPADALVIFDVGERVDDEAREVVS